uniref:Uncharacterized protein n=1 Tax=Strombidium inclinatum TaxID=197538 RepID=A0A7S3IK45_9SPIT|mmetsp:Transcript_24237/g.37361  ORF Transcript_24237/g.37361 Transcript_24237/m.37361 type:complete len:139 (+) Transcript_24237:988-1404(+)
MSILSFTLTEWPKSETCKMSGHLRMRDALPLRKTKQIEPSHMDEGSASQTRETHLRCSLRKNLLDNANECLLLGLLLLKLSLLLMPSHPLQDSDEDKEEDQCRDLSLSPIKSCLDQNSHLSVPLLGKRALHPTTGPHR